VAIFVRVSTINRQDNQRQITELEEYAKSQNYEVVEVVAESISGRANADEREGLHRILTLATEKRIKKVLVHEVSRIARRSSIVHKFVEDLHEAGVSLYWHSQRIETLLPSGKKNPSAAIMMALLSEIAANEVEVLRERILSGLAETRRKGVQLGRRKGTSIPPATLLQKHGDIVRKLKEGQSIRNTAAITKKRFGTVVRVRSVWISAGGHQKEMQATA
jgi:DNA invertase Pin-like site-specific DNA recombinase